MSNYLAIGSVSATLRNLLSDRMDIPSLPGGATTVPVTITTPGEDDDVEAPRINLYLYRISESAAYKNQEIPGHGHPAAYGRPPLSLELHYLVTAYGAFTEAGSDFADETVAQYLLGSAMRVLHDYPIITASLENQASQPILDVSLQGEFERIKLTLNPLSLEDLSKIWTALALPMRPSAAYKITVVQIESKRQRSYAKPVGELPAAGPRVKVVTLNTPKIDDLRVKRQGTPPADPPATAPYARIGDTLVLQGTGFIRGETAVRIGDLLIPPATLTETSLTAVLPDDPSLEPGVQAVKVTRTIALGDPETPHTGFHSNLSVFMLVPRVTAVSVAAGVLTVQGTRLFAANKDCQTVLGDTVIPGANYLTATPEQISLTLPSLPAGDYGVRVRVNGAECLDQETITIP